MDISWQLTWDWNKNFGRMLRLYVYSSFTCQTWIIILINLSTMAIIWLIIQQSNIWMYSLHYCHRLPFNSLSLHTECICSLIITCPSLSGQTVRSTNSRWYIHLYSVNLCCTSCQLLCHFVLHTLPLSVSRLILVCYWYWPLYKDVSAFDFQDVSLAIYNATLSRIAVYIYKQFNTNWNQAEINIILLISVMGLFFYCVVGYVITSCVTEYWFCHAIKNNPI